MFLRIFISAIFLTAVFCSPCRNNDHQIRCRNSNACINSDKLCDGVNHCSDGSDEDEWLCGIMVQPFGCPKCSANEGCDYWTRICKRCPQSYSSLFCQIMKSQDLAYTGEPKNITYIRPDISINLGKDLTNVLQNAVKSSPNNTKCPILYVELQNMCLSFFSPAMVTWNEGKDFCKAIGGSLFQTSNISEVIDVQQYILEKGLTSDYWIGGHFDDTNDTWKWINEIEMPSGTPLWTLRHDDSCPRKSSIDGRCYEYIQAPIKSEDGQCASVDDEVFHYITDARCNEKKSVICLYDRE